MFDLTATNIVGKYPGKSGLNMLLHLVSKVIKMILHQVSDVDFRYFWKMFDRNIANLVDLLGPYYLVQ